MIGVSNVCTAFEKSGVGTRVLDRAHFMEGLEEAVEDHRFPINGQATVQLDPSYFGRDVSCGVARRQDLKPDDYVVREWRGEIGLFARRRFAANVKSLPVIVYTRAAYLADPDVQKDSDEHWRVYQDATITHVIVAVRASAGPEPTVSSHRFVRNLSGGNNAYSPTAGYTLDKAIADAKAIEAYEREWVTVAD